MTTDLKCVTFKAMADDWSKEYVHASYDVSWRKLVPELIHFLRLTGQDIPDHWAIYFFEDPPTTPEEDT